MEPYIPAQRLKSLAWIWLPVGIVLAVGLVALTGSRLIGRGASPTLLERLSSEVEASEAPSAVLTTEHSGIASVNIPSDGNDGAYGAYVATSGTSTSNEDGSGSVDLSYGNPSFVREIDAKTWRDAGDMTPVLSQLDRHITWNAEQGQEGFGVKGLSTDPKVLEQQLRERANQTDNSVANETEMFENISLLLQSNAAPSDAGVADFHAALLAVLDDIAGVRVVEGADSLGRPAVVASLVDANDVSGHGRAFEYRIALSNDGTLLETSTILLASQDKDAQTPFTVARMTVTDRRYQ